MAAAVIFVGAFAVALTVSLRHNGGRVIYALDDPYIHMAMAKNMARHGVWGISQSHFTSSSSSLLWTAALSAVFFAIGPHEIIPLALNFVLALGLLFVAFRCLASDFRSRPAFMFLILSVLALAAPLPALIFVGQEHILHAIATVLFVDRSAKWLTNRDDQDLSQREFVLLCVIAAVLPLIRYESLFGIAIVSGILLLHRRWTQAAALALSSCLPVLGYGAVSASLGWYWLPNSVLMKGSRPDFSSWSEAAHSLGYVGYTRLMSLPALAFLVCAALAAFLFRLSRERFDALQWMLIIFIGLTLAHTQFAQPQAFWMYRYEAYLIVLGLVVVGKAAGERLAEISTTSWPLERSSIGSIALLLLIVISPLSARAVSALAIIPQATTNIYEQQYQMGLFLRRFYEGAPVALNDIGAASYLADIECIDLVGLANMAVARRVMSKWYLFDDIQEIADEGGVKVAIVYDSWFRGRIPAEWRKAGAWTIRNNVVTGGDTVTFYAARPDELVPLRANLQMFGAELPPTVVQRLQ